MAGGAGYFNMILSEVQVDIESCFPFEDISS